MSFLTRIILNKEDALKQKLFDPYRWHQFLWKSFPEHQGPRDFLFRVDDHGGEYQIYLLSRQTPEKQASGEWETKTISPSFLFHNSYRFQLRANPVKRKHIPQAERNGRKNGPIIPVSGEAELREWMVRQGKQNGFEIESETLLISPPLALRFRKNGTQGTVSQVDFNGRLTVSDAEKFKAVFNNGIGKAKSFGFGLMLLSAANNNNN